MNEQLYEIQYELKIPHGAYIYRGTRKTKAEWLALGVGFRGDDFLYSYGEWFRLVDERDIEVDICVSIVSQLLDLPHSCSHNALQELEQKLRTNEANSGDVAKSYGFRIAADYVKYHIDNAKDPTEELIRMEVKRRWEKFKGR